MRLHMLCDAQKMFTARNEKIVALATTAISMTRVVGLVAPLPGAGSNHIDNPLG
jgi:hypothetical protein